MWFVPVGERVAGVGEVGADDAQVLVGEVAQPPRDVGVGCMAEPVVEVGGGGEDLIQRGEDSVVGGRQLDQGFRGLFGGGGLVNAFGDMGDGRGKR